MLDAGLAVRRASGVDIAEILSVNRISLRCPATVPHFAIAVSRAIVSPWSTSS